MLFIFYLDHWSSKSLLYLQIAGSPSSSSSLLISSPAKIIDPSEQIAILVWLGAKIGESSVIIAFLGNGSNLINCGTGLLLTTMIA